MQQSITPNSTSREIVSTVTGKGQVTVPREVRKHLGIDINDKIAFIIEEGGDVKVTQVKYPDIQSLRGVAGTLKQPLTFKEIQNIAREDRLAKKYAK
ncbi:type II toxin-antitoxin system PrlF family antitoxin [Candidatus Daviesbacteria bacterium]|nr:type II toxin-antitoxin system PrlF family antitoxin [Candidatus Daviesbacteria bacterium]